MIPQEQYRKVKGAGRRDRVWLSGLPFAGGKWDNPKQDSLIWLENSLICGFNSLLSRFNSLFRCVGNCDSKRLICSSIPIPFSVVGGSTERNSLYFPS